MKKLYGIVILDLAYLRDFKLSQLDDETSEVKLVWNNLLKINPSHLTLVHNREYICRVTNKSCRYKLNSASRWKTLKGAEHALKTVENRKNLIESLKKRIGRDFALHIVEISEVWNNTLNSEIELEKIRHINQIKKLEKKLI